HATALAHHWGARMGGVADEQDATAEPLLKLQPFDRPTMDLLVALELSEILPDRSAEPGEAMTQPFEAALHCIVQARRRHVAEPVGASFADCAQPEETSVAQPELHSVDVHGTGRRHAAPHHLSAIHRRRRPEPQFAHGRVNSVCADDEVVLAGAAVAKLDRDAPIVLMQRSHPGSEAAGDGGGAAAQRLLQPDALDANHGADVAPQ